jgi:hypothetical protein
MVVSFPSASSSPGSLPGAVARAVEDTADLSASPDAITCGIGEQESIVRTPPDFKLCIGVPFLSVLPR